MKTSNEKTTIYLNAQVKKYTQFYALRDNRSLSDIINERLSEYLEDMADIAVADKAKHETSDFISLETAISELGLDSNAIQGPISTKSSKAAKANR